MCLIPFNFIKLANSWETNCGPLSITICSGSPYAANSRLSSSMILVEVVLAISIISGHFECASVTNRNILFKKGLAKSVCILSSMAWWARAMGAVGQSVEYSLLSDMPSKNVPILQIYSWPPYIATCFTFHSDYPQVIFVQLIQHSLMQLFWYYYMNSP